MTVTTRSATVICTTQIDDRDYVLLGVPDPRWRVGPKDFLPSCDDRLPVGPFKFIGGYVDENEILRFAARREFSEEAGRGFASLFSADKLNPIYTMTRPSEVFSSMQLTLTYFHVHMNIGLPVLERVAFPDDDVLGLALVAVDQIVRGEDGYMVQGKPKATFWRNSYISIPYKEDAWVVSPPLAKLFDFYNDNGKTDPWVGISKETLGLENMPLFVPSHVDPSAFLTSDQASQAKGGPVPDGAVFMQLVKPRLSRSAPTPHGQHSPSP